LAGFMRTTDREHPRLRHNGLTAAAAGYPIVPVEPGRILARPASMFVLKLPRSMDATIGPCWPHSGGENNDRRTQYGPVHPFWPFGGASILMSIDVYEISC